MPIIIWAASAWMRQCKAPYPACLQRAKRSAAPTVQTGSPATRFRRRLSSAAMAGISAAAYARKPGMRALSRPQPRPALLDLLKSDPQNGGETAPAAIVALQQLMDRFVGPLRTETGLNSGLGEIARLESALPPRPPAAAPFAGARRDWFDLRNMLLVARTIACAALTRRESRGAHQREDYPSTDSRWEVNQTLHLQRGEVVLDSRRYARICGRPPDARCRNTADSAR